MKPAHIRNEQVGNGDENIKHLNLIIKANTHGAAEALSQGVSQLESKEIITRERLITMKYSARISVTKLN